MGLGSVGVGPMGLGSVGVGPMGLGSVGVVRVRQWRACITSFSGSADLLQRLLRPQVLLRQDGLLLNKRSRVTALLLPRSGQCLLMLL